MRTSEKGNSLSLIQARLDPFLDDATFGTVTTPSARAPHRRVDVALEEGEVLGEAEGERVPKVLLVEDGHVPQGALDLLVPLHVREPMGEDCPRVVPDALRQLEGHLVDYRCVASPHPECKNSLGSMAMISWQEILPFLSRYKE